MDTLVVGQEVRVRSGVYGCKGKVVKITPDCVEVLTVPIKEDALLRAISMLSPEEQKKQIAANKPKLFRFDKDGNELDDSRRARLGFGPPDDPTDKFHKVLWYSAPECQSYHMEQEDEPPVN
jgi:hypothetical protein